MAGSKEKARELRRQGLPLSEVARRLGIAKSTASLWLRDLPLDEETQQRFRRENGRRGAKAAHISKKPSPEPSKYHVMAGASLSSDQKGRIAEAAVLFRLTLLGLVPFRPTFEGNRVDWFVENESRRLVRLQVKWMARGRWGQPVAPLTASKRKGRYRYQKEDFDLLVGYDLLMDTAHVFSWEDIGQNTSAITATPESAEAWHKLNLGVA